MTTHHFLTLDKKIDLINDSANGTGLSQRELSVKYQISKGAVNNKNVRLVSVSQFGENIYACYLHRPL